MPARCRVFLQMAVFSLIPYICCWCPAQKKALHHGDFPSLMLLKELMHGNANSPKSTENLL
jgi:hypothetical protein